MAGRVGLGTRNETDVIVVDDPRAEAGGAKDISQLRKAARAGSLESGTEGRAARETYRTYVPAAESMAKVRLYDDGLAVEGRKRGQPFRLETTQGGRDLTLTVDGERHRFLIWRGNPDAFGRGDRTAIPFLDWTVHAEPLNRLVTVADLDLRARNALTFALRVVAQARTRQSNPADVQVTRGRAMESESIGRLATILQADRLVADMAEPLQKAARAQQAWIESDKGERVAVLQAASAALKAARKLVYLDRQLTSDGTYKVAWAPNGPRGDGAKLLVGSIIVEGGRPKLERILGDLIGEQGQIAAQMQAAASTFASALADGGFHRRLMALAPRQRDYALREIAFAAAMHETSTAAYRRYLGQAEARARPSSAASVERSHIVGLTEVARRSSVANKGLKVMEASGDAMYLDMSTISAARGILSVTEAVSILRRAIASRPEPEDALALTKAAQDIAAAGAKVAGARALASVLGKASAAISTILSVGKILSERNETDARLFWNAMSAGSAFLTLFASTGPLGVACALAAFVSAVARSFSGHGARDPLVGLLHRQGLAIDRWGR